MKVVTEEYGNSPTAQKWGVRRYPVVFVDDVLGAPPDLHQKIDAAVGALIGPRRR